MYYLVPAADNIRPTFYNILRILAFARGRGMINVLMCIFYLSVITFLTSKNAFNLNNFSGI